jgi:glycosyltransferase involved in cell wall biosynthesis
MPRVSVVTPVWNAAATLAEAVASVRAQTLPDWEMILVDDGSTDRSRALAEALAAAEPRLRVLGWAENRGAAAARNAGIRAARGRYIAFLDADDRWRPEKLALQLAATAEAPFVFSAYGRMDAAGRRLGEVPAPPRLTYAELLKGNRIGCLTALYDTAHFGKVEMPELRRRQDYGLWLKLLKRGPAARGLPQVLADYRVRPGSLSADKWAAARATWAVLRELEGLPLGRAGYCFLHYAGRGLLARAGRSAPLGRLAGEDDPERLVELDQP